MFKSFRKPFIKSRLVDGGDKASVKVGNASVHQAMILLYMTIKQVGKSLGMDDPRQMLNALLDLDKRITRNQKDEQFQAKYGKPRRKKKKKK